MTNIEKGLYLIGKPAMIPDCNRDDLPQFFVDRGFQVGAEIGVYKGEFTEKLCQTGLKIYGIDPWMAYYGYDDKKVEFQKRQDFLYEHTQRTLKPYPNCTLVRKTSMDALKDFPDGSLDFVYIDGNHNFKYIAEDLCEWTKKVKKGGVVSGHDYSPRGLSMRDQDTIHVKYVVDAYTLAYEIKNWYVLGRDEIIKGEKRDKFRSWMWIK